MYAAHAKRQKEETSSSQLNECLQIVNRARSDSEKFAALLEISDHVLGGTFTSQDRQTAVQAVDRHILKGLIHPNLSSDLHKSIALSVFAAISVDQSVISFPEIKDILCLVNDIICPTSQFCNEGNPRSSDLYRGMCRDCEELVFKISQLSKGPDMLVEQETASLLLDYFPKCQSERHVLSSMASIMHKHGDRIYQDGKDKLDDAISIAVEKLGEESNLTEKVEYAQILTHFLTGLSLIEVSMQTDWVVPLASTLQKLILHKWHPDDSDAVMLLIQAFVSAVGPSVLDPKVTGGFLLLKAVVARVAVEVYMLLDCIHTCNALERHSRLDGTYKLLCGAVQCAASLPEDADPESVIIVYRKLVDTRDTIIEFLYSVANQELDLPRNHSVVLISVRALAAMLTEITEEPTENLLKLLPFFNLLCQPVEYADDVILEVKNATQAALENIKLMGMDSILEAEGEREEAGPNEQGNSATRDADHQDGGAKEVEGGKDVSDTSADGDKISKKQNYSNSNVKDFSLTNGDGLERPSNENNNNDMTNAQSNIQSKALPDLNPSSMSIPKPVELSPEILEEFRLFQETVTAHRVKPSPNPVRRVSFSGRLNSAGGTRSTTSRTLLSICAGSDSDSAQSQPPWTPGPDDVLGFLLPAYLFLVGEEKALQVMVEGESFHSVVSFLQRALAQMLEGDASQFPELMITNALAVIEQVHTNSPDVAIKLHCFQDLFEIFMLSIPNLVNLPSPPPVVSMKMVETSLITYKLQMMARDNNTTLQRLKHSRARYFKAVLDHVRSVCEIRQHKRRPPSFTVAKKLRTIWPDLEEPWASCLIGLSQLVGGVEELQEILVKSPFLAEVLGFLRDTQVSSLEDLPAETCSLVEGLLPLLEKAAAASDHVCQLMLYNKGLDIARKFNLKKLGKHLLRYSSRTPS